MKKLLVALTMSLGLTITAVTPAHAGVITGVAAFACDGDPCTGEIVMGGLDDADNAWHSCSALDVDPGCVTPALIDVTIVSCPTGEFASGTIEIDFRDDNNGTATLEVAVVGASGAWVASGTASISGSITATGSLIAAGAGTCSSDNDVAGAIASTA